MKNTAPLIIFILFYTITNAYGISYDAHHNLQWSYAGYGIRDISLAHVAAGYGDSEEILISSNKALYRRPSINDRWNEILSFTGSETYITSFELSPLNPDIIAAGTSDGLFISRDNGSTWIRAFNGIGTKENFILSTAFSPHKKDTLFTGTAAGLFISTNGGKTWVKDQGLPSKEAVSSIAASSDDHDVIYAALNSGLYKSMDNGKRWNRIFITSYNGNIDDGQVFVNAENNVKAESLIRSAKIRKVLIDKDNSAFVYLATSEGLFISRDGGMTWRRSGASGLTSDDLRHIIIDPADRCCLYAATGRGVFRYSNASDSWTQSYKGLNTVNINQLAYNSGTPAILWAATDKGLFRAVTETAILNTEGPAVNSEELISYFNDEPSIEDVQKAAIIYAEVHPDKIKNWRKNAARKAWLPDLRVDFGQGRDWQSSTYFYSTSSEKYKDNDITEGDDYGWSVSLSWDLGDLIWSSDQTSIDTRSRLMVQLRDDVLNEVTRLYYERSRLQIERLLHPEADTMEEIERSLRLEELTADINAMTGFSFSKRSAEKRASAGSLN